MNRSNKSYLHKVICKFLVEKKIHFKFSLKKVFILNIMHTVKFPNN